MLVRYQAILFCLLTPAVVPAQDARPGPDDEPAAAAARQVEETHVEPLPAPHAARAGDDEPLGLPELEGLARQHHPALAAAAAHLEMARGRYQQAGLYPNPVAGYHATEVGNLGTAGQQGAFFSQRIITAGKLRLDRAVAGHEIDEFHFLFHAQEQRVLNDVRVRFYEALVAQRRLTLTRDLASIGDDLVRAGRQLRDARQASENDVLQAEIEAEQAHILLDNARQENFESWRRLAAVIGLPTMQMTALEGNLDGDLPVHSWEDCYALAIGRNLQLDAAGARAERAWMALQRARKEAIPNVDVSVSVRHHNVTRSDVANLQLGLPLPIFDRNQGRIRSAEAEWIAARNEVKRLELDLQDQLAVVYRRYESARQQVQRFTDRILPRARRSLDLVTNGYEQGQVNYLTLLTTQRTYVRVNLDYLDSIRELRRQLTVIEGQLLSGSLTMASPVSRSR